MSIIGRLVGSLALASVIAGQPSFAADSAAPVAAAGTQASDELQEIVVTGSRIRGASLVGSSSISVDQGKLQQNTAVTIADILRQVPQFAPVGVNETSSSVQGVNTSNLTRAAALNLHGAGPVATLVLLDGQRMIASGQGGIYVDPSTIPAAALEKVEIVPDGGSAIYGSDAIAGVVNLILRRNYDGAETSYRYGLANGYSRTQFSQIGGLTWSSGSVMAAYENVRSSHLAGADRSFFRSNLTDSGGADFRSTFCSPGNISLAGTFYAIPALTPGRNRCELVKLGDVIPAESKNNVVLSVNQSVSSHISLFAEGYYSDRAFDITNSPLSGQFTVPGTNAFFIYPGAARPASEAVEYNFNSDLGPAKSIGTVRAQNLFGGIKADLPGSWRVELSGNYGNERENINSPGLNTAALNAALASNNPATAVNPFGVGTPTSAATLALITTGLFNPIFHNDRTGAVLRADGELLDLPGGTMRAAIGAEYYNYKLFVNTIRGTQAAPSPFVVKGARYVSSAYAELYVPIVGEKQSVPAVQRLELSAALRTDKYSDFGRTNNPKVGVTWSPINGLDVKASYGTSFRAPTLSDVYNPSASVTVNTLTDPLSPTGSSTGLTISNFNAHLKPESATTRSFGFDFKPQWLDGLKLNATWFSIDYRNQIIVPGTTALQQGAIYANLITRNPTPAQVQAVLALGLPLSGVVPPTVAFLLDNSKANLAATLIQGLDFGGSYTTRGLLPGSLTLGVNGTHYSKYDVQLAPAAPVRDRNSYIGYPISTRAQAFVNWQKDALSAGLTVNYQAGETNNLVTPVQSVASLTTLDLQFAYSTPKAQGTPFGGIVLGLDVSNLFNSDPPFVNQNLGYDPASASPVGRMVSVNIRKNW